MVLGYIMSQCFSNGVLKKKREQISFLFIPEGSPRVGPTLRAGVDYRCFLCCAGAQGDYPIAIALEGEAIYEIEQTITNTKQRGEGGRYCKSSQKECTLLKRHATMETKQWCCCIEV